MAALATLNIPQSSSLMDCQGPPFHDMDAKHQLYRLREKEQVHLPILLYPEMQALQDYMVGHISARLIRAEKLVGIFDQFNSQLLKRLKIGSMLALLVLGLAYKKIKN
uniref:Uncharacterized protein n=1 Tax=Romanomermis culicivorax TaxID=13658 RepID=A0A915J9W4_ROMCU